MMFNSFSHPCEGTDVIINVLSDAMIVVGVDMLVDVETIIVVTTAAIALEFVETVVLYDADVLGDIRADVIIGVVTDTGADVLADVMTALEFAISQPFQEFSCWAAFDCCPLALLDSGGVLQAWMPSNHV